MEEVVFIEKSLCTGCELCVEVCGLGVLYIDDFTGLAKVRNQEKCDKNGACVKVCKTGAIRIAG